MIKFMVERMLIKAVDVYLLEGELRKKQLREISGYNYNTAFQKIRWLVENKYFEYIEFKDINKRGNLSKDNMFMKPTEKALKLCDVLRVWIDDRT